jgi:hypothetical protein
MEEITNPIVNNPKKKLEDKNKKMKTKKRNIKLRTPTRIWIQAVLATIVVVMFLIDTAYIVYSSCNNIEIGQSSMTAITALSSLCGIIINYYFGSSESSRNKDDIIQDLKKSQVHNPCEEHTKIYEG